MLLKKITNLLSYLRNADAPKSDVVYGKEKRDLPYINQVFSSKSGSWSRELVSLSFGVTKLPLQVIDSGIILHQGSYLREIWNIMDAVVVICAAVSFTFDMMWVPGNERHHPDAGADVIDSVPTVSRLLFATFHSFKYTICPCNDGSAVVAGCWISTSIGSRFIFYFLYFLNLTSTSNALTATDYNLM